MKERKPHGYWKKEENILAEAMKVMKENGFDSLPGSRKLSELGYCNLIGAIQRHYKGFRKFREAIGQEQLKREKGLWEDKNYCISEANKFLKEHPEFDTLPYAGKLEELGYNALVGAIHRHYGGFRKFREILGEEQKERKKGIWKSLDFTLEEANKFLEEHPEFDSLPGKGKLEELGYSALTNAICSYHDGMVAFRAKLNEHLGKKTEKEKLEELLGDYAGEK